MTCELSIAIGRRTENDVRITFAILPDSETSIISGAVRGPFCDFAKTLTADFALRRAAGNLWEALLVEPCYWTPRLPFWYDLRVSIREQNGTMREEVRRFGIKRFYAEGHSFFMEGKRIVLRGLSLKNPKRDDLLTAREAEIALIVTDVDEKTFEDADRLGVPLVIDRRHNTNTETLDCARYNWHASVMMFLASTEQLQSHVFVSQFSQESLFVAQVGAEGNVPEVACDAYAIELEKGERPTVWLMTCEKPVIAIRKEREVEIATARQTCGRLQADLAPEFDLAGYFV